MALCMCLKINANNSVKKFKGFLGTGKFLTVNQTFF